MNKINIGEDVYVEYLPAHNLLKLTSEENGKPFNTIFLHKATAENLIIYVSAFTKMNKAL